MIKFLTNIELRIVTDYNTELDVIEGEEIVEIEAGEIVDAYVISDYPDEKVPKADIEFDLGVAYGVPRECFEEVE